MRQNASVIPSPCCGTLDEASQARKGRGSMAQFVGRERVLPEAVLDRFKYEVASELGLQQQVADGYWGEVRAADCGRVGGKIGGAMVRVLIRQAEEALVRGQRL